MGQPLVWSAPTRRRKFAVNFYKCCRKIAKSLAKKVSENSENFRNFSRPHIRNLRGKREKMRGRMLYFSTCRPRAAPRKFLAESLCSKNRPPEGAKSLCSKNRPPEGTNFNYDDDGRRPPAGILALATHLLTDGSCKPIKQSFGKN